MRLDKYLQSIYPEKSRTYIQKLISDAAVKINDKIQDKNNFNVSETDKIEVIFPKDKVLNLEAKNIPLKVIYEDKNILIINKDAGISVHPGDSNKDEDTLVNAVLHHCKNSLSSIGGVVRPGIVHRLDKDTSGVLMIAKNDETHRYLSDLIKNRKVKKTYLGLVHGKMETQSGTIDAAIGRDSKDRKKMGIRNELNGRNAITHFKVIKYFEKYKISLLELQIITGRTHQIRVHMSAINHPILFDETYGDGKLDEKLIKMLYSIFHIPYSKKRQMLHAHKLSLLFQNEKKERSFEASLPSDFDSILSFLKQKTPLF